MKNAITIPAISNNINTTIGTNTPTSTTVHVDVHLQPPSDVVLAVILGTPFACGDVYLCSIEVDGDSSDVNSIANGIFNHHFINYVDVQHTHK